MGGKACFKGLFMPKSLHKNRLRNPEVSTRGRIVMAANGPMHTVGNKRDERHISYTLTYSSKPKPKNQKKD